MKSAITIGIMNFNPLPRKEGDALSDAVRQRYEHFNPLPRKEGDSKYS